MFGFIMIHGPWREKYESLYVFMRIVYEFMFHLESEDPKTIVCNCGNVTRSCFPYPYTWLCMNEYEYGQFVVDWKVILMNTLWIRCERFNHMKIILSVTYRN